MQCSDKIRFPQLCIKYGVAKSGHGTNTALQAPMLPSLQGLIQKNGRGGG